MDQDLEENLSAEIEPCIWAPFAQSRNADGRLGIAFDSFRGLELKSRIH